ncbi:type I restriction endonuclease subunit R, partial [Gleimia europaea]|nr:type I restriction endonuclease subunit R [Gleimia europaea]
MNENPARHYDPIAVSSKSTVVASYEADPKKIEHYQSEAALEREFIHTLQKQAYEYLPIKTEADLVKNLRQQLETLNNVQFSASEWEQFFHHVIASKNAGILDKTKII